MANTRSKLKQLLCCGAEIVIDEPWEGSQRRFPTFYQVSRECQTGYKATRSQVIPAAIRHDRQVQWEWQFSSRNEAAEWLLDNYLCK